MPEQVRQLQVGEVYVARNGDQVRITKSNAGTSSSTQRWEGQLIYRAPGNPAWEKSYKRYSPDGSWKKNGYRDDNDLVRVLHETAPAYAPAPRRVSREEPVAYAPVSQPSKIKETPVKSNSFFSSLFKTKIGQVRDGLVKYSMTGKPAVRNDQGAYIALEGRGLQDVTQLTLDAGEQLLFRLPVATVNDGDIIIRSDTPGAEDVVFVTGKNADGSASVINPRNGRIETVAHESNLFFPKFYTKVVSLADLGGANSAGAASSLLPFLLLGGDEFGDTDKLLPLLMMSGGLGGQPQAADANGVLGLNIQSILPMLLISGGGLGSLFGGSKGKDGDSGIMQMMLMSQLFGGGQAGGLFGNLFGQQPAAPAAPTAPIGGTVVPPVGGPQA